MLDLEISSPQPAAVSSSGVAGVDAESMVGRHIGNFIIKALLGSGGMASVYLAVHPEIDRLVAIKVLARRLHSRSELSERFLVEARAIAKIDHPCIVEIYDFGRIPDGRPFYVMEHLAGQELSRHIRKRVRFSLGVVHQHLELICSGLSAIHDAGLIHSDLKPENIIILEQRPLMLKLIDLGLARDPSSSLVTPHDGLNMGTPLFISPEQAAFKDELVGPRSDLYSLGVILYWLLSGRPPFYAETSYQLLSMHISSRPRPLHEVNPALPREISAVVERCLEKDPDHRPASADALLSEFARAVRAGRNRQAEAATRPSRHQPQPTATEVQKVAVTQKALLNVDEAVEVMRRTDSLEELFTALASGALNVLQFVRLYLRQRAALIGVMEMQGGAVRTDMRQLCVHLDGPSIVTRMLAGGHRYSGQLPAESEDSAAFLQSLPECVAPAREMVIFPVVLPQRVTILLLGCHEARRAGPDLGATLARLSIEGALALDRWPDLGLAALARVWPDLSAQPADSGDQAGMIS